MAERQRRDEMKAHKQLAAIEAELCNPRMGKQALLICFVFLTDYGSNKNIILTVKYIWKI